MSLIETRRHQMFPVLDMAQVETARRFASGEARSFAPGEVVYDVGERHAPAWLVVEGTIDVVGRDGLDHEVAITTHGPGQITGEAQSADRTRRVGQGPSRPGGLHRSALRRRAFACARGRLGERRGGHARVYPAPRRVHPRRRRRLGAGWPAGGT